ncbi:MAG: M20 family metallopeptidase [Gammaproteobacteria bacterium]|nr:M20 family metallopeptidase [Gammaproteobacteria bacterium]
MQVIAEIQAGQDELTAWRRHLHSHPELAYEEVQTAEFVAQKLDAWGLRVHRGLATTGVIGTLERGAGRRVGLRADMDALPIHEANTFEHRSRHDGKMHACGHDGHTAMLLGAARYLAEHGRFEGTIQFIFQPAEEAAGGAKVMIDEGLFETFPVDAVFGMHNWPGLDAGRFAMRTGPMMASMDCFDMEIQGHGAHGALPHNGVDPVAAAAQVISALQTVVSRNVNPLEAAVISVTKIHGGDAHNVIPDIVQLGGAIRCFDDELRAFLCRRVVEVANGVCEALGATIVVNFNSGYPAVKNWPEQTELAASVATAIVGEQNVDAASLPVMVSEDFAFMLKEKPGCYVFIGNGAGEGACMIHNPDYDFNDAILPLGSTYWVRLAESFLGVSSR